MRTGRVHGLNYRLSWLGMVAVVVSSLWIAPLEADVVHVDPLQGADVADRGASDAPYRTVTYALSQLAARGVEDIELRLAGGEYVGDRAGAGAPETFPIEIPPATRVFRLTSLGSGESEPRFVSRDSQLYVFQFVPRVVPDAVAAESPVSVVMTRMQFESVYSGLSVCGPARRPLSVTADRCFFTRLDGSGLEIVAGPEAETDVEVVACEFERCGSGLSVEALDDARARVFVEYCVFRHIRPLVPGGVFGGAIEIHADPAGNVEGHFTKNRFLDSTGGFVLTTANDIGAPRGKFSIRIDNSVFHSTGLTRCTGDQAPGIECTNSSMRHGLYLSLWPERLAELSIALVNNTFLGIGERVVFVDNQEQLGETPIPLDAVNNVFWPAARAGIGSFAGKTLPAGMEIRYSLVPPHWDLGNPANGNFSEDPQLPDDPLGSFLPPPNSSIIDRGLEGVGEGPEDLLGRCRLTKDRPDVGAVESRGVCRLPGPFRRGDCNLDETVELGDAITLFSFLFLTGRPLRCHDACDANDDGMLNLSDGIYILQYLFLGEREPPEPFQQRGWDETPDQLPPCPGASG
ncbi:MAG: DUF1565 domain-containing protein [Planctomycetota bacterium]|nr:DUF1565 domain-containing protein [Planctomycetota bacterium]